MFGARGAEMVVHHAGLDDGIPLERIDFLDRVHALEGEDDAAVGRVRSAGQTGPGAG